MKASIQSLRDSASRLAAAAALATASGLASAQTATDPVALIGAQSATAVAVCGAFLALGVAVWGGLYISRKFFGGK